MKKRLKVLLLAAIVLVGGFLLLKQPLSGKLSPHNKLKVMASFYPMAEFARQVGGQLVDVTTLVKPGVEPHDYDPTPQEMLAVHRSKVLVVNGMSLEPWAAKIRGELERDGVIVVTTSDGLKTRPGDPHLWLDPVMAVQQVRAIEKAFSRADPVHRADYAANATYYIGQLQELDRTFRTGLATCNRHEIVTAHEAFAYLAARYGFEMRGITGLSPDEEPSPQVLADTARYMREHQLRYVFFEDLAAHELSYAVAEEVGATSLFLNPLEGLRVEQQAEGQNYLSVQRTNLENLRIGLDCT